MEQSNFNSTTVETIAEEIADEIDEYRKQHDNDPFHMNLVRWQISSPTPGSITLYVYIYRMCTKEITLEFNAGLDFCEILEPRYSELDWFMHFKSMFEPMLQTFFHKFQSKLKKVKEELLNAVYVR